MAKDELPREDLMAEAKALVPRVELRVPGLAESVVVGFRANGAASFFFDQDPAYHFNSQHELRRAYAGGYLYKAERGRLIRLTRARNAGEVALVRHELTAAEQEGFLTAAQQRLHELGQALLLDRTQVVAQEPHDADAIGRAARWLDDHVASFTIAVRPNAV